MVASAKLMMSKSEIQRVGERIVKKWFKSIEKTSGRFAVVGLYLDAGENRPSRDAVRLTAYVVSAIEIRGGKADVNLLMQDIESWCE